MQELSPRDIPSKTEVFVTKCKPPPSNNHKTGPQLLGSSANISPENYNRLSHRRQSIIPVRADRRRASEPPTVSLYTQTGPTEADIARGEYEAAQAKIAELEAQLRVQRFYEAGEAARVESGAVSEARRAAEARAARQIEERDGQLLLSRMAAKVQCQALMDRQETRIEEARTVAARDRVQEIEAVYERRLAGVRETTREYLGRLADATDALGHLMDVCGRQRDRIAVLEGANQTLSTRLKEQAKELTRQASRIEREERSTEAQRRAGRLGNKDDSAHNAEIARMLSMHAIEVKRKNGVIQHLHDQLDQLRAVEREGKK